MEGEALAGADALDKSRHFVLGCKDLIIAVDHKPLLKLFGDRSLEDISNSRLRNLKEKTLRYQFRMVHIPGAKNRASDTVSRYPTGDQHPPKMHLSDDISNISDTIQPFLNIPQSFIAGIRAKDPQHDVEDTVYATAVSSLSSIQSITWDRVCVATTSDNDMAQLVAIIEDGMPEHRHELPEPIRVYHQFREHLYTVDGVVFYKDHVMIPPSLRQDCLAALHAAHQGASSMISRAETSVFWPGITTAIMSVRNTCNHCNRMAPSQPSAPPTPPISPAYPFQCVCSDFFHYKGTNYLVIVDRYSNWPIIERSTGGATGLINCLRKSFVTYGIWHCVSSGGRSRTSFPSYLGSINHMTPGAHP